MLVIGLTGSIGSGKSTVASLFAQKGIPVIDADVIAREVTTPGTTAHIAITSRFGDKILLPDGTLDRRQLRDIIFQNAADRLWLEELLHPQILAQMQKEIASLDAPYCIAVIPLLNETNAGKLVQRTLVVDIPEDIQLKRASLRDNSSPEQIKSILKTQHPREQKLASADDVIDNSGPPELLTEQVEKLHQMYLQLSQVK